MSHVISRLSKPLSEPVAALYYRSNTDPGDGLSKGNRVSFDTYFNAHYEALWSRYTTLERICYQLRCKGHFRISLSRSFGKGGIDLLSSQTIGSEGDSQAIAIEIPPTDGQRPSRLFLEMECLEDGGEWQGGELVTEQPPAREVSLAVVTCTFHKEGYIKKNVSRLMADPLLQNKKLCLFLVDNGQTLTEQEFSDPRVRLFPNRNLGGSGGFTRGLIEAVHCGEFSHFLIMDDDIVLDTEVIYRLISFYEYANQDIAVCGSMLDLLHPTMLLEAGAKYTPVKYSPLKQNLDLGLTRTLDQLFYEDSIDYGGFWFFALTRELVGRIGMPMPFFIKVDDMEYGLRAAEDPQTQVVSLPGIGVWHEPHYAKLPVWDIYYYTRNDLIANTEHGRIPQWMALARITRRIFGRTLLFDYNSARMVIEGLEDFLRGPDFMRRIDPEAYHQEVLAKSNSYSITRQRIALTGDLPELSSQAQSRRGWWMRMAALLTLNGHILPPAMLSRREPCLIDSPESWDRVLGARSVVFVNRHIGAFRNHMDHKTGLRLLADALRLLWRAGVHGPGVARRWRQSTAKLRSIDFLCTYYGFKPRGKP